MSTNSKIYRANCHCAQIRYTVEVSPPLEEGHEVTSCNCSICIRDGKWHIYISKDKVHFTQGEDQLKAYDYNTLTHKFCPTCGTSLVVNMRDPNHEFANEYALNVRAFHDVDFDKLKLKHCDMRDQPPKYDPYRSN